MEDVDETPRAEEELGRESYTRIEAGFELTDTQTQLARQCRQVRGAPLEYDASARLRHRRIALAAAGQE